MTVAVPGLLRTGSPANALFTGDRAEEHAWFAAADSLPLLSMDAGRAARRLVGATLRRRPEVILTPAAQLGARLHGVAPATALRLLGLAARFLPSDTTPRPAEPGRAVAPDSRLLRVLTTLGRRAGRRTGEHADPVPVRRSGTGPGRSP